MRLALPKFPRGDAFIGALLSLAVLAVYLRTLAPSVGFTDAGELAAVAATFGIAHPTGYPLFTLLAGLFAKLPLGGSLVWRLNLFAALCTAASVFFFFRFFLALLRGERKAPEGSGGAVRTAADIPYRRSAAVGALTLAFSRTFWEQSTGVEVYSLHLLMVSLVLFLFAQAMGDVLSRVAAPAGLRGNAGKPRAALPAAVPGASRWAWPLFAFCLGLSFANHMTTVLLLPGLAGLYFAGRGFSRPAWLALGRALPPFFAGLSLYLYLPLRAAAGPLLNWGNPVTFENFWRHLAGRQYSVWMFTSADAALGQLAKFAADFPVVFGGAALAPMAIGLAALLRNGAASRRLALFTVLLFAACVLYAINYDIHDIASYFLLAHAAAAFWVARGALALLEAARGLRLPAPGAAALWVALGGLCALSPLVLHHRTVDARGDYAVEDYSRNLLASLEPGATLISVQWDLFIGASYYLQVVEGIRPDVTVIDRELLRRSWYLAQLERSHPRVVADSRAEVDAFLRAVRPFERGEPYDGAVIQAAYEAMIRSLLARAAARGPLYCTPEMERSYLAGWQGVPDGLAFRLFPEGTPPPFAPPRAFHIRPIVKQGPLFTEIRRAYAAGWYNMAYQQGVAGNLGAVRPLLDKALAMSPGFPQALELRRRLDAAPPTRHP